LPDHPSYPLRLIRQLGFTLRTSQLAAMQRDGELIRARLRKIWPRIKNAQRLSGVIVFSMRRYPEAIVEWLHPYAPEINPEEYCLINVKE